MTEYVEPVDIEELIARLGFLALNGTDLLSGPVNEADAFIRRVADGSVEHAEVVAWLGARATSR